MNILEKILATKKLEVQQHKETVSQTYLESLFEENSAVPSFTSSIAQSAHGIIAEFKRKSPSKGWMHQEARVEEVVPGYVQAGAAAVSVLTDMQYFGGSLNDLKKATTVAGATPLLRKEFIIDEYQLYEAKVFGAQAVLLIAAALTVTQTKYLAQVAQSLGLEVLLEVHNEAELGHITPGVRAVGVNNRNLSSFVTSLEVSFQLAELIPEGFLKVSESGISTPDHIRDLRQVGYRGFLLGEVFMKNPQPGVALEQFVHQLNTVAV